MKNILLFLAFISLSIFSFAQTDHYWSGQSGSSDNIDQSSNWFNGNPSSGDNLYFNNTAGIRHYPYSNYGGGSYFNYLITYNGAGGIRWRGDKTYAYKFENNSDPNTFEIEASISNRGGSDFEINPVGGGITILSASAVDIQSSNQLKIYGTNTLTVDGIITGTGSINVLQAATVILNNQNTYTGSTTISTGVFQLAHSGGGTLPSTNNITVSGGTLRISTNQTLNDLSVTSGTLTVDAGATLIINGTFTGGGTINNNGKIILVGPSSFPGNTTIVSAMNDLEINRSAGVALDKNLAVNGTITLTNGALDLNGTSLTVNGAVSSGSGSLKGSSTSNLTVGGTAGTLSFTSGGRALQNFTVNNGASATLGTALDIYTALTIAGSLNLNAQNLTLKSTASNTGRIDQITGTLSGASNVTLERYIPALSSRRYRILTAPVTGTTINASWQEGMVMDNGSHKLTGTSTPATPIAGYGTLMTGKQQGDAATANANGFDFWTAIANSDGSVKRYVGAPNNGAAAYVALDNTTFANAFDLHQAYQVFIRGDRTVYTGTTPFATTLRATGTVKQGNQSATVFGTANQSHTLLGNPYPAPLDFYALYNDNSSLIKPDFYVWNAALGTGTGGYVLMQSQGNGNYDPIPGGNGVGNTSNRLINSGGGFFVIPKNATDGTLSFSESQKSTGTPGQAVFRTASPAAAKLYVNVSADAGGVQTLLDGALFQADASFNTSDDIQKAMNAGENLSVYKSNSDLIVSSGTVPVAGDAVQLRLWNTTVKDYVFEIRSRNFSGLGLTAVLEDNFLHTQTHLSLNDAATSVPVRITSDPASQDPLRFRILFSNGGGTLPLYFTRIAASENSGGIAVTWSVATEQGLKSYEVEKSTDGRTFQKFASLAVSGLAQYRQVDAQPSALTYYRVKGLSAGNEVRYSEIVKVKLQDGLQSVLIYPNPVRGGNVQLTLTNQPKGLYTFNLYNTAGQRIWSQTIAHAGGTAVETIQQVATLPAGIYKAELRNAQGITAVQTLNVLR